MKPGDMVTPKYDISNMMLTSNGDETRLPYGEVALLLGMSHASTAKILFEGGVYFVKKSLIKVAE